MLVIEAPLPVNEVAEILPVTIIDPLTRTDPETFSASVLPITERLPVIAT